MSKSFMFLVESYLSNFHWHLATFYWSHCPPRTSSSSLVWQWFAFYVEQFWRRGTRHLFLLFLLNSSAFWKVISTVLDTRMEEGWDVGNLTVMVLEWIGVIAPFHFGSGCSSVGRAVPSEISDQRFETCDRQFYFQTNCIVRSIKKTKILFFN